MGIAGIFFAYFPVYFFIYAATDDYVNIYNMLTDQSGNGLWEIKCGRPVYAIFIVISELLSTSINDLIFFRFFCVLSICTLFVLIHRFFLYINLSNHFNLLVLSFCICLIPAFQVYASWFVCYSFVLSVIMSLMSFWILINKKIKYNNIISAILLVSSFSLYQPAAMSFVFFACCHIISSKRVNIFFYIKPFIILCIGMLSALLLAKYIPSLFFNYSNPRASLSIDVIDKITWFIYEALKNAAYNFSITKINIYLLFSLCIIFMGVRHSIPTQKNIKITLIICGFMLSYAPNLLTSDNWAAYRSLVVLELFTCMFFCIGFMHIFKKYGMFLLPSILVYTNIHHIYYGYVAPQQKDYQIVKEYISQEIDKNFVGHVMLDTSKMPWCRSKPCRYDEFGISSSKVEWAISGMLEQIRQDTDMKYQVKGTSSEKQTVIIQK